MPSNHGDRSTPGAPPSFPCPLGQRAQASCTKARHQLPHSQRSRTTTHQRPRWSATMTAIGGHHQHPTHTPPIGCMSPGIVHKRTTPLTQTVRATITNRCNRCATWPSVIGRHQKHPPVPPSIGPKGPGVMHKCVALIAIPDTHVPASNLDGAQPQQQSEGTTSTPTPIIHQAARPRHCAQAHNVDHTRQQTDNNNDSALQR